MYLIDNKVLTPYSSLLLTGGGALQAIRNPGLLNELFLFQKRTHPGLLGCPLGPP